MKRFRRLFFAIVFFSPFFAFCQEEDLNEELNFEEDLESITSNAETVAGEIIQDAVEGIFGVSPSKEKKSNSKDFTERYPEDLSSVEVEIPDPKRPKKADSKKLSEAQKKDEDNSEFEENKLSLLYGTPAEIKKLVDSIVESEDPRYTDLLYDLFYETNSNDVREKILSYFAGQKDPCLEDYAVEALSDPYDLPLSLVNQCMTYVSDVESRAAAPALVKLVDSEEEKYFNGALSALGKTGGAKEALFLASYLERDDLETPQRQALMRTLGKMKAEETFDSLVEIATNEDENSFVRMYAAEAIGAMKKDESIPILIDMYERGDPNMREYCIRGLENYPDSEKAKKTILQGIRDDHYKVRLQSIKSAKEMKLEGAVDFLIYRAKNDSENAVKKECYPALAELNTKKANEYLVSVITDKKTPDSAKNMAAEALLKKEGKTGIKEIASLAESVATDDKRKPLRYSLGKLLAKYPNPEFSEACSIYINSKDAQTASLGVDMYKNGRFEKSKGALESLASDKTRNSVNRKRARKLLGLSEEDEEENSKKEKPNESSTADAK